MKYYLDLFSLGFWIAQFILALNAVNNDEPVFPFIAIWAIVLCVVHYSVNMIVHEYEKFLRNRAEQEKEDD